MDDPLAVKISKPPVNGIEEVPQSPYRILLSEGSSVHKMFTQAEYGSDYHKIFINNRLGFVKNGRDGVYQLANGIISHISYY